MVKRWVRVYIEGGAEGRKADNEFRENWGKFLRELHAIARNTGNYQKLNVIRLKGRSNAFEVVKFFRTQNSLCSF